VIAKRCLDVLVASAGLLLLGPLLVGVAVAIKLDSPGPVFFRQVRVGRHGREFRIHKFRTMVAQQDDRRQRQITVGEDPRITRVGAWLRRTKVDELAQFIDVLQGTMSLVGPRPEVPRYVALYPAALRERVLSVKPGITDLASLAYRDESTLLARAADPEREYVEVVMPAKLAMAARYAEHPTVAGDLVILWRTLGILLGLHK
jgi:lipopolysaccharide/colanic/teichoic acid biosynthesis glycosyltransferase